MNYEEFSEIFKEIHWRKECAKRLKNATIEQKRNEEKFQKVLRGIQVDNHIRKKNKFISDKRLQLKRKKEEVAYGKWLCKNAYYECQNAKCQKDLKCSCRNHWQARYYSPMRYVSQQEIDEWLDYYYSESTHELSTSEKCPHVSVVRHFSHSTCYWIIWEPGFYRVEHREYPSDNWISLSSREGMPTSDRNYVVQLFEQQMKAKEKHEANCYIEGSWETKVRRYNAMQKKFEENNRRYEQIKNTRGITPDEETTSFFQALAVGSLINK